MKFDRNITVEDKFENVYKFVQKELNEEIPMPVFHEILGKLDKWQDKKRRAKMEITPLQTRVYEVLAKHDYKPSTLYKYALFLKSASPNILNFANLLNYFFSITSRPGLFLVHAVKIRVLG